MPFRGKMKPLRPVLKRKRFHRKKKPIVSTVMLKQLNQIFPDRLLCKLNLGIQFATTGTAGATNVVGIGGNFLHNNTTPVINSGVISLTNFTVGQAISGIGALIANPNVTTNFAPYLSYRIHSSAIEVECNSIAGTSGDNCCIIVQPITGQASTSQPGVGALSVAQMYEQPYVKHKTMSGFQTTVIPKVKNFMSTRKLYGLKYPSMIEDAIYTGIYGINPSQSWFWQVILDPITTQNTPMNLVVKVTYTIEFFTRVYDTGFSV